MHSHEIPSNEWIRFFDDQSRRHQGEHVTVEVIGPEIGDQNAAADQSLLGISVDPPTGSCRIQIMAGEAGGANIAQEISHPIHVRLAQAEDGHDVAIEIESDTGPKTLLRFLPN